MVKIAFVIIGLVYYWAPWNIAQGLSEKFYMCGVAQHAEDTPGRIWGVER